MSERDQPKPEDAKDTQVQPDLTAVVGAATPKTGAALEAELQAFIGRQLQATYDEVLNEPIPDRFLELLQQLEQGKAGNP